MFHTIRMKVNVKITIPLKTVAFWIIILGSMIRVTSLDAQSIRVMTYNIRYNNPSDGENAWPRRKEQVGEMLRRQQPDILCFQEVLYGQLKDLQELLPGYRYVGIGREKGRKGEFSPVFYRDSIFRMAAWKTVWLSESRKPGSKGWDASLPRIFTYAELEYIPDHRHLLIISTHFDHKGVVARQESALQLLEFIREYRNGSLPVILGGDMNAVDTSRAYQNLVQGNLLEDAFRQNLPHPDTDAFTCCGFGIEPPPDRRIDYIFITDAFRVVCYQTDRTQRGNFFLSDHLPVIVELEWESGK